MIYGFGNYLLDTNRQILLRNGAEVALEPQVYRLLELLLSEYDNLVTTDRIVEEIWDGRIVSEAAIASRIHAVRAAIGDDGRNQNLVRTVRGRGFRFVGEVTRQTVTAANTDVAIRPVGGIDDRPVLAILPFRQDSAAAEDLLAESLVEGLTTALSRIRDFAVIARQSVLVGAGEIDGGATMAATRLGATYVVDGSVRRGGKRIRVTISLTRAPDAHTLWSQQFDDELDDVFNLQDRLVAHVAGQLAPSLRSVEVERAVARAPRERSAYELTLTALPLFWRCQRDAHEEALARLERAIEIDPTYGPAQAYRAWCLGQGANAMWTDDPEATYAECAAQARAAQQVAGDHAPSLVAIGSALTLATDDMEAARILLDRALTIDPSNAWGWMRIGWVHYMTGDPQAGLAALARAERLSPLDPFLFNVWFARAACHRALGDLDMALKCNAEGHRRQPGTPWAERQLLAFRILAGDDAGARVVAERLLAKYPDLTARKLMLALPRGHRQNNAEFVAALERAGFPGN